MTRLLMISIIKIRPDITFVIFVVSYFTKNLSQQYIKVVKTIMCYLKAIKTIGIIYGNIEGNSNLIIKGYTDSNQADNKATRKLISIFILILNGGFISQYSKRQAIVAFSLTKAEYVILTLAVKEYTWLRLLLTRVGLLDKDSPYTKIKVIKTSIETE